MSEKKTDLNGDQDYDPKLIVTQLAAQDTVPWYQKPNLRYLYFIIFPTCIGVEMTSGFDSSLVGGLQAVDSWVAFFNKPGKATLGLMTAMYSLGSLASLPVVPFISDRFGRRMSIVFGSIVMCIGAIVQTTCHATSVFIVARLILGFGIPFAIVGASSLLGELGHPKERPILGSLFNACWFIGSIVAAGVTTATYKMRSDWGWRLPSLLQLAPSVLQLAFIYFLPESPRWLISKGREDEALQILIKYHAEGDANSEFAKAEFVQIQQTLELEKEQSKTTWADMVKVQGLRRRVIIGSFLGLATQWSGNTLISYYLPRVLDSIGITDNRTKNQINLGNSCWGFLNATVLALTMTKFKRRTVYLTCVSSLTVIFTAYTIASARYTIDGSHASSVTTIFFIFLYSPFYNMAFNALTYTFLVELFPFHARAKGIVIFQFFGRLAAFFNQFVNPIGMDNAGWKYYICYCVVLVLEVIFVYFMFPETSGRTLEELAFLFEDDRSREQKERVERQIQEEHRGGDKASSDHEVKTA